MTFLLVSVRYSGDRYHTKEFSSRGGSVVRQCPWVQNIPIRRWLEERET